MKAEGYNQTQIAKQIRINRRTVSRLLLVSPELLCVDGTQTRTNRKLFDPYKAQICELIELGLKNSQIRAKFSEMHPDIAVKRTTFDYFCRCLREELFDCPENSKAKRARKLTHSIKRRELASYIWSDNIISSDNDLAFIHENYPVFVELKRIISEFRADFTTRNSNGIALWCAKYEQCSFPAIRTFIKGIYNDFDAFFNSMRFTYSNGLLEGSVNKLKAVKRSMYGRASYKLLRAKLLLANSI